MSDMTPAAALEILGLEHGASRSQIKQAYRDLAKVWHPDRFQDDPRVRAKAEAEFKQVTTAYEALKSYRPAVRSRTAAGSKARSPARPEATPPPPPKQEEGTPPPRTPPPDPRSTRRPEQRGGPAPRRSTSHMVVTGILIWGAGVVFGVLLVFTLLSQSCSEPVPNW